jgi:hypothetical protein
MNFVEKMKNKENVVIKFADKVTLDGVTAPETNLSPGLTAPTADGFLSCMVDNSPILDDARIIRMTSVQHNLEYLNNELNFSPERSTFFNGTDAAACADNGACPDLSRKVITAIPVFSSCKVSDNFVLENIAKEGFLSTYTRMLAERAGPAYEKLLLTETLANDGADGILAMAPKAADDVDATVDGIVKLVKEYIAQGGSLIDAVLYAPAVFITALRAAIAMRETPLGDASLTENGDIRVAGILVKHASNLDALNKVILTTVGNIAVGLLRDIDVQTQYDICSLSYINVVRVSGGVQIICDKNIIVADVAV